MGLLDGFLFSLDSFSSLLLTLYAAAVNGETVWQSWTSTRIGVHPALLFNPLKMYNRYHSTSLCFVLEITHPF